jgi:hypothetical protein
VLTLGNGSLSPWPIWTERLSFSTFVPASTTFRTASGSTVYRLGAGQRPSFGGQSLGLRKNTDRSSSRHRGKRVGARAPWIRLKGRVLVDGKPAAASVRISLTLDDNPGRINDSSRSAGRVKTREQLLVEVADRDYEAFDRSIDVHISSLRKKLGDDSKNPRYIETVRSVGYRMKK